MPSKRARKLVFFVCDDNDLGIPPECEIDIWHADFEDADPQAPSVNRWISHCRQAYRAKEIYFDALSIDVFFSDDGSDPANILDREVKPGIRKMIPSGLYHGLAAMARRGAQDRHGNIMPFAWEVRTASPQVMEHLTNTQRAEIIRVYGLFLAIANPYQAEEEVGFLGLGSSGRSDREPWIAVQESFERQPQRVGAGIDMDRSLLPKWRNRMIEAIAARSVRADRKKIEDLLRDVRQGKIRDEKLFENPRLALPLVGRDGLPADAIKLSSIFYDYRVKSVDDFTKMVAPWLEKVVAAVGTNFRDYVEPAYHCVTRVARSLAEHDIDAPKKESAAGKQEWEELQDEGRCLVMIGYYLSTYLDRSRFPYPNSHALFCGHIGPEYNTQTLARPFRNLREAGHVHIATFDAFEKKILSRIAGANVIFPFSPDFMSALAELLERLNLEPVIQQKAPALLEQLQSNGWFSDLAASPKQKLSVS